MSVHFVRDQQQTAVPPVDEIDLASTVESNTSFKHLFKTGSVLHKSLNSGIIISEGGARLVGVIWNFPTRGWSGQRWR